MRLRLHVLPTLFRALLPLLALNAAPVAGQVVINEVDYDQVGTDTAEFLELKNIGSGVVNLSNYTVLLINGNGGGAATYDTINLPNVNLAAGDYFVICANAATVANCDLDDSPDTDFIQNGSPDAIGLLLSGVLVDAVSYEGNSGAPYTETSGVPTSASDSNTVAFIGLSRFPDGTDTNNNSADWSIRCITPGVANTSASTGCTAPVIPLSLSVNDISLAEGNAGTTTFTFTVTLSSSAGAGGVTFDIGTADGTAQDDNPSADDNDYVAKSLTGQTIPFGSSTYTFDVLVNGDTAVEGNETFFVNVTNVTGATVTDGQGLGTIVTDDFVITPIHDIQGSGNSSPLVGNTVVTRGIVTGVRFNNGFFIQEPDASADADPLSSEGIFVFTSSAPPAAAAVGNYVQVAGTVAEFVPSADPFQPPVTELTSPTVTLISAGNPLPAPIPLTATFPDPAGGVNQLERLEGMRVSVASLTVVAPTGANTRSSAQEANGTSTSNGVFYGVVTGVARPFREAGIQADDPAPSGTIPPIPRFDANPERIRVDSDGQVGASAVNVSTAAVVTGLVGPLDYSFRTYTILPDPAMLGVTGGTPPTAVTSATGAEFTIASFNLERFFDTVDDAGKSDVAMTSTGFANRLAKASLQVRQYLGAPDILAVVEVENLSTLQTLAAKISTDAIAAGQPDPQYTAYLVEGNDIGGIDVGFLVKTAPIIGATPRVTVVAVLQELAGTLFTNPDASTELLNDRPPLRLRAIVNHANGSAYPVTVIANHLRSLNDIDNPAAGSNGWPTSGARVRAKRLAQAQDLADLVQARQTADPSERIVLVGDFNAFEVNDGYVDVMNLIAGTPPPDNETAVPGDGVDLVNPDFVNLFNTPPAADRYSYVFDGNAQSIDHILVNAPLASSTLARREEHARINADFPETDRSVYAPGPSPCLARGCGDTRLSDHDPVVSYYTVQSFITTDLSMTMTASANPVPAGDYLTYLMSVSNLSASAASSLSVSLPLPGGTTFKSVTAPGWSCTTPPVDANGTVTCTIASLAGGATSTLSVKVAVNALLPTGTGLSATATLTSGSTDPNLANNTDDEDVVVSTVLIPGMTLTKTTTATGYSAVGDVIPYTLVAKNTGTSMLTMVVITDPLLPTLTCTPSQPATLLPGATLSCAGSHAITPADMANGSVTNTATATAQGLGSDTLFGVPEGRFTTDEIARTEAVAVTVTAQGTVTVFGLAPAISGTRLALQACTVELQQDWLPRYTKLQFEVWNEDEVKFTGAFECADSWHETDFTTNLDAAQQNFTIAVLGTYGARYRVQAVTSTVCPGAQASGILAVQSFLAGPNAKAVGTSLAGAGKFTGSIKWDPAGAVPEGSVREPR